MYLLVVIFGFIWLEGVKGNALVNDLNMDIVRQLVAKVEAIEAHGERLQQTINEMQGDFIKRENELLERIANLESKVLGDAKTAGSEEGIKGKDGSGETIGTNTDNINRKRRSERTRRLPAETEVAFYSTSSKHDNQHLGLGQDFILDTALTNLGNAYSTVHGVFTAPVTGTYIFHATICGRDVHTEIDSHYYAYFDVDGHSASSKFIVTPYDQSSQMLVIDLQAGSQVSVRNTRIDDGYVGQGYTSFSGFLLYEHETVMGVVG